MSEPSAKSTRVVLILAAVALVAGLVLGRSLNLSGTQPAEPQPATPVAAAVPTPAPAPDTAATIKRYQVPVSPSQPTKGPADAVVTIVEWCDFSSPECRKVESVLTTVLAKYPHEVRLAFRHFVDPTGNPEAHEFTRIAFDRAGKFWEAKAIMMGTSSEPGRAELQKYAAELKMDWADTEAALDKHSHAGPVIADRTFAQMFGVQAAPALIVNGRRLQGEISVASLTALVDDEIARSQALVSAGIAKDKVYAELTKNGVWEKPKPLPN